MLPLMLCWFATAEADETVFDRSGRYGHVQVHLDADGRRTLTIDGARQSTWKPGTQEFGYGYLHAAAAAIGLAQTAPQRALVIGLGGGTLSRWLTERGVSVRAIEIDPLVVRAARRWFDLPRAVHVQVADGRRALEGDRRHYDLIVIDAASQSGVPPHLLTLEFLDTVREHLTPTGIALANSWTGSPVAVSEAATWAAVFGDVSAIQVRWRAEENRILVAGPGLDDAQPMAPATRTHPAVGAPPLRDATHP